MLCFHPDYLKILFCIGGSKEKHYSLGMEIELLIAFCMASQRFLPNIGNRHQLKDGVFPLVLVKKNVCHYLHLSTNELSLDIPPWSKERIPVQLTSAAARKMAIKLHTRWCMATSKLHSISRWSLVIVLEAAHTETGLFTCFGVVKYYALVCS